MSEDNQQSAIVRMHGQENTPPDVPRTFICFGTMRGGTSAVGGVMHHLGIFMGENLPNNYEDPDFVARKGLPHMKKAVTARNAARAVWGWKFPNASNYLEQLLPAVRNPHLVVVFRDLVATMKAHMRWHDREVKFATHELLLQLQRNWFLVERWQLPTVLVSYEKAVLAPELFVQEVADFLGRPRPEGAALEEMVAFLRPGSYK